jgi:hypothetical protein
MKKNAGGVKQNVKKNVSPLQIIRLRPFGVAGVGGDDGAAAGAPPERAGERGGGRVLSDRGPPRAEPGGRGGSPYPRVVRSFSCAPVFI